jgi:hypothetical protein
MTVNNDRADPYGASAEPIYKMDRHEEPYSPK